jgi:hypothetical protein
MSKIKVGDTLTMDFHCAGMTSQEPVEVTHVGKKFFTVDDEWDVDYTGKVLNDNNWGGAKRTIRVEGD